MRKISKTRWTIYIYAFLTLSTLALFLPVRNFDFVDYDDPYYVSENPNVKAGLSTNSIIWAFTAAHASNWHPVTWLSHMLDCELFGTSPGWHHLTNLLLHILNVLLVFGLLRRMTGALWQSAFVAAAFALHPLHVESVAWIAERKDVLSTLFWMLTVAAYLRYAERPGTERYLLTLLVFALGLMAKPMLVTLPFVLLLLDYWPFERFELSRNNCRVFGLLLWEKIPFFILSAVSSVVTFLVQRGGGAVAGIGALSTGPRLANASVSYVRYIVKLIWPAKLAIFYPYPVDGLPFRQVGAAALALSVVTIFVIYLARRYKYLATGWFWYLGTLVPVIGIVQVGEQAFADRYTYVTYTGLFIIIAWGVPDLLAKWRYRKVISGMLATITLLALSRCTSLQLRHWRNSVTLSEHALKVTDDNYVVHCSLGNTLGRQGKIDLAIAHSLKALQIYPDYWNAHYNMGNILAQENRFDEAVTYFNEVLRIRPDCAQAYKRIAMTFLKQGKLDESVSHCRQALRIEPLDSEAHNTLGIALGRQGKFDQAVTHFTNALQIKPDFANAHGNLGYALAVQGKYNDAAVHLTKAVQLDPNAAASHYHLAKLLAKEGKLKETATHFRQTIRLRPDWPNPVNDLAWLLATTKNSGFRNPAEAVKLAQQACELTEYKKPALLDTLAVAYAANGDFTQAIETAEKALELARRSEDNKLAEQIKKRLSLYRLSKPYTE